MANIRRTNFLQRERWQYCSVFPPPASWRDNQQRSGPSGRHTWLRCKARSVSIGSHAFPCAVAILELSGLVSGGGHPGISQQLVRGVKAREIPNLSQDHGSHTEPQSGNRDNGRMEPIHNGLDLFFDFCNLSVQFADKGGWYAEVQGTWQASKSQWSFGQHRESQAPYPSCSGPWRRFQEVLSALLSELRLSVWRWGTPPAGRRQRQYAKKERVFPIREQNADQPCNGAFQFGAFFTLSKRYLVSDFSSSLWYAVFV